MTASLPLRSRVVTSLAAVTAVALLGAIAVAPSTAISLAAPEPVELATEDTHTIAEVQGSGTQSPLVDQVVTTSGVVTAAYPTGGFNGYYIQTPGTGTDLAGQEASHGVFVYSASTVDEVAVGDFVRVRGTVTEYNGLTEITVNAGDAAVLDDVAEPVVPIAAFEWPAQEAARELVEGMLVAPTDDYVVSDTYFLGGWGSAYGSIGLGLGGPLRQETDVAELGTAAYDEAVADNTARAITLDDGQSRRTRSADSVPYLTGAANLRTGASLEFVQPVIVDYRFQWNFQPTSPVTGNADDRVLFNAGNTQAVNAEPVDVGGDLTLGSFNVLNYFTTLGVDLEGCQPYEDRAGNPLTVRGGCAARGAWDQESFERQRAKIVTAINGMDADVVALAEIENSVRFGRDRDAALGSLVDALNADAGTGRWAFAASPGQLPELAAQDVIRNAFIYNPAAVELNGDSVVLTDDPAFSNAREPLAQTFTAVGTDYSFTAVANHFKSKGGDCGDLPQGCAEEARVAQAQALTDFAAKVAADAGHQDVFLLGDFNAYSEELPAQTIEEAGYTNLNSTRDAPETTYVYQGKVGSLDHVFANTTAAARVTGVDIWSINSAQSVLTEYSRHNYFASEHFQAGTPFRASDHDPLLVGVDVPDQAPAVAETVDVNILSINDFHGRLEANRESAGAAVLSCAVDTYRAANPNTWFVSAGDNIGASTFTSFIAQDQPTIDVLNEIGVDASALGNHEFDRGQDDVNDRVIPASEFPLLGANIVDASGEPAYEPFVVTEKGGVSVGFIGVLTQDMPQLVSPSGIDGLTFTDMGEAANKYAALLSDGDAGNGEADVIVVLAHDGAPSAELSSAEGSNYGKLVDGASEKIDAIISGHTHQMYTHDVDGTWVTQASQYGESLGHLSLTVDAATGDVVSSAAENVDLVSDGEPICPGDPAVQQIVDEAVAFAEKEGSVPLGEITDEFNRAADASGAPGSNRAGESTLGNFVSDVQLWAAKRTNPNTQIAFMNPGGLRDDMQFAADGDDADGVITYAEAAGVQPFANTLVTMDLTGAQIEALLEQQWRMDGVEEAKLHLGVSAGFSYVYDPAAPLGDRITLMSLDGEPVAADESYTIVTNSFLSSGGDGFSVFTEGNDTADSGQVDLAAMVDYFDEFGRVSPDFAQRAVGATWVSDAEAVYAPGDEIAVDISSFAFSTQEPVSEEVTTTLQGVVTESAALDATPVDGTDEVGRAQVRVTVPEVFGVSGGQGNRQGGAGGETSTADLMVTDPASGSELTLPVQIAAAGGSNPGGSGTDPEAGVDGSDTTGEGPDGSDAGTGGGLATTGAQIWTIVLIAVGLLIIGIVVVLLRRRSGKG